MTAMDLHYPGILKLQTARPIGASQLAPVVFDSPHSGSVYPEDFNTIAPKKVLLHQEDSYVNQLFAHAPCAGATLLEAEFPRSYIDPNRAEDDLDIRLLNGDWPTPLNPTEKTRLGHGLIWYSYPENMPMYDRLLDIDEISRRIESCWRPYHHCLEEELMRLYALFGGVWHVNCHSMPSTSSPFLSGATGGRRADMVLGTLDHRSCSKDFADLIQKFLEKQGYNVRLNYPYKGAELIRRYASPVCNRHSLQIEINRALYLEESSLKISKGFRKLQTHLGLLAEVICDYALNLCRTMAAE